MDDSHLVCARYCYVARLLRTRTKTATQNAPAEIPSKKPLAKSVAVPRTAKYPRKDERLDANGPTLRTTMPLTKFLLFIESLLFMSSISFHCSRATIRRQWFGRGNQGNSQKNGAAEDAKSQKRKQELTFLIHGCLLRL